MRPVRSVSTIALLLLSAGCSKSPEVAAPVAIDTPPPPPSGIEPSRFRPVSVPPSVQMIKERMAMEEGELLIDESGVRWLLPPEGPARSVTSLDMEPIERRKLSEELGILVTTRDGRLLVAKQALGPFSLLATLPKGAKAGTEEILGRGLAVQVNGALLASSDGATFAPVPGLPGYELFKLRMDEHGVGVGIFLPETVAFTKSRGQSWTVVSSAGVEATALEVVQGKVALLPGGVRDGFARVVDVDTGTLSRAFVPRPPQRGAGGIIDRDLVAKLDRGRPALDEGMPDGERAPRLAAPHASFGVRGAPAIDGDRVIAVRPPLPAGALIFSGKKANDLPKLLTGRLGEELTAFGGSSLSTCSTGLGVATCGSLTAVACSDKVIVFRDGQEIRTYPGPRFAAPAFDAEGRLFSLEQSKRAAVVLRSYDLGEGAKMTETIVPGFEGSSPHFVGGCQRPGLWAVTSKHAAPVVDGALGETSKLAITAVALAVNHEKQLVVTETNKDNEGLLFLPSGERTPFEAIATGRLSLAEDGKHGLATARNGQALETNDGGRSFARLETPQVREPLSVYCGKTRCQLGSGAIREGFVRATVPPEAWPDPVRPPPRPTPVKDLKAPKEPKHHVVMTCQKDAAVFRDASSSVGLAPRLGNLVFAGIDEIPLAGSARTLVFGDDSGAIVKTPFGRARAVGSDPRDILFASATAGVFTGPSNRTGTQTTRYLWEPDGKPFSFVDRDAGQSSLAEVLLLGEGEVASFKTVTGGLVVWGSAPPRELDSPGLSSGFGPGAIVSKSPSAALLAMETDKTNLRILSVDEVSAPRDRIIVVRRPLPTETGVGIVPGDTPKIILVETTDDGRSEIRIRALAADFSLGPAVAVPGTRGEPGHFLKLASCGKQPSGTLLRVRATVPRSVAVEASFLDGIVHRFLRVTEAGACVERTAVVSEPESITAQLVVAGDGGIAASTLPGGGLRCSPLTTSPPPETAVPSP